MDKLADVFEGLGTSIKQQIETTKNNINSSELSQDQKNFFKEQLKTIEKGIAENNINDILTTITKINDTSIK